jgi:urease accessory protein UreF
VLGRCRAFRVDDLGQPAPLIELWQGAHDRLYSRLFQS